MKKLWRSMRYKLLLICLSITAACYAGADTLTTTDYHYVPPKHMDPVYNGPFRFIVVGVILAVMAYVGYRYYASARGGQDIWHDPQ